jgi:hypothetical protein
MYSFIYIYINVEVEVIKNETCISIMMKYVLMFWSSYHHIPNLSWSISLSVFLAVFPSSSVTWTNGQQLDMVLFDIAEMGHFIGQLITCAQTTQPCTVSNHQPSI